MKARQILLGAAVAAGLGITSMASAATVSTILTVTDLSDAPIAVGADGKYHFTAGQQFRVVVGTSIADPYTSSANRTTASLKSLPLGLASLTVNLNSVGGVGLIAPNTYDAGTGTPWWSNAAYSDPNTGETGSNYMDLTPGVASSSGLGYAYVNCIDVGNDGDLDPAGVGFVNQSQALAGGTTLNRQKQQVGLAGFNSIASGDFTYVGGAADTVLTTIPTKLVYYTDPNAAGNLVSVDGVLSSVVNAQITIAGEGVVPEPAAISLLGLGALGLLRRRH